MNTTTPINIKKTIFLVTRITTLILIILAPIILISSCSSGDKEDILDSVPEHEHDEVSKIVLQFRNIKEAALIHEFAFEAPEGTTEIPITDINLPVGTYKVEIKFYSLHGNHFCDDTDDIFIDDADDHFVFYQTVNASGLAITYADDDMIDTLGRKLGQRTQWTLTDEGQAKVYIYLLHQPAQKDPNVQSTAQLGGEIDLEAHYSIKAK